MGLRRGRGADHERIGPHSIRHVVEGDQRFYDSEEHAAGAGQEDVAETNRHTGADANPIADYRANAAADLPNANADAKPDPDPDPGANPNANRSRVTCWRIPISRVGIQISMCGTASAIWRMFL